MIFRYLKKNIRSIDQLTDKNNLYLVPERTILVREFTGNIGVFLNGKGIQRFRESNKSLKHEMS